jgi:hypothetical protein
MASSKAVAGTKEQVTDILELHCIAVLYSAFACNTVNVCALCTFIGAVLYTRCQSTR